MANLFAIDPCRRRFGGSFMNASVLWNFMIRWDAAMGVKTFLISVFTLVSEQGF
jgi:hypothetical protein